MKRIVSFLTLLFFLLPTIPFQAKGAAEHTTRAIYVVFDNSGSMYLDGKAAWCQATYAMEMFASMLDFDQGDSMRIYTMHPVITDGTTTGAESSEIDIASAGDIQKIHNMYTPYAGGTPYEPVTAASEDLRTASAKEKWLLVLTDGSFDTGSPSSLQTALAKIAASQSDLFVQYLAMGSTAIALQSDAQNAFYADKTASSSEVVSALANIGNRIFKRNSIPSYTAGTALSFDIPVKKLIVFAQGSNVSVNGLTSASGASVSQKSNRPVSYSTLGTGRYESVPDTSLQGVVVTFENTASLDAGEYTLDVSGAEQINVYYEPDVDFGMILYDKNGNPVEENQTVAAGEYLLKMGFLDRTTGDFIQGSDLIGDATYTLRIHNQDLTLTGVRGAPAQQAVTLNSGTFSVLGTATYLSDYTASDSVVYEVSAAASVLEVVWQENQHPFSLTQLEDSVLTGTVMLDGAPLSDGDMDVLMDALAVSTSQKVALTVEKGKESSTICIYPKYYNGEMTDTDVGEIFFTLSAEFDNGTRAASLSQQARFEIYDDLRTLVLTVEDGDFPLKELESGSIPVTITRGGKPLSETEWQSLQGTVSAAQQIEFTLEPGSEVSTFLLSPRYFDGDMMETDVDDILYTLSFTGKGDDGLDLAGGGEYTLSIQDISFLERYWWELMWLAIVLAVLLGYIPPFKKYLPRNLKRRPKITKIPVGLGPKSYDVGSMRKYLSSTLIPYRAQRGEIRAAPLGISPAVPVLKVKAAGQNGMWLLNTSAYAGKKYISFDGDWIEEKTSKNKKIFSSTLIKCKGRYYSASCVPNQD